MSDTSTSGLSAIIPTLFAHGAKITELEQKLQALEDLVARLKKESAPKKPLFGRGE